MHNNDPQYSVKASVREVKRGNDTVQTLCFSRKPNSLTREEWVIELPDTEDQKEVKVKLSVGEQSVYMIGHVKPSKKSDSEVVVFEVNRSPCCKETFIAPADVNETADSVRIYVKTKTRFLDGEQANRDDTTSEGVDAKLDAQG